MKRVSRKLPQGKTKRSEAQKLLLRTARLLTRRS